jgi:hypothetical protein
MTNVVEFPALLTGPITEGQTDKIHSQAFRDLEGRLSDCVCMARIARELAANAKIDDDELIFAIGHAAAMLKTLQSDYYAAWHNEKPLDP